MYSSSGILQATGKSHLYPRWEHNAPSVNRSDFVNLREVAPGLYVGSERAVIALPWAGIVSLNPYANEAYSRARILAYLEAPRFLYLPIEDGEPICPSVLDAVARFVQVAHPHGPVLLHCRLGLSRSASVAYAVLRLAGLSHGEALRRIKVPTWPQYPCQPTLDSARAWAESNTAKTKGRRGGS